MATEVTFTMSHGSDATVAIPTVVPTAAMPTGAINMAAMPQW